MKCKDCNGRGRWTEKIDYDGITEYHSMFCGTCKGTGQHIDVEDDNNPDNVFSIGATENED